MEKMLMGQVEKKIYDRLENLENRETEKKPED